MADQKETWFCRECGGLNILHDAVAKWNPETEMFEVEGVLDGTWCEDCIAEANSIDVAGDPVFGIPGSTEEDDAEEK